MAHLISDLALKGFCCGIAHDPEKPTLAAADSSADGTLAITDPIRLLNFLFIDGDAPPPPFPGCGVDPSPEGPSCDAYPEELCR